LLDDREVERRLTAWCRHFGANSQAVTYCAAVSWSVHNALTIVRQKLGSGYTQNRQSRISKGIPCFECYSVSEPRQELRNVKEGTMYAAIRQGKAKPGTAEELARTIKEGAIPIISDVPGFKAYYVIYAPDDTVTAISIFDDYAGAAESNRRGLAWIEKSLAPLLTGPATAVAGPVIVHTLA
jgi:hypothetical protein